MRLRIKLGLAVIAGLVAVKACQHRPVAHDVSIPDGGIAAVVVGPSHSTLLDPTHTGPIVVPNYGHGVTVVVKPDGKVVVKPKTRGWTFDAGLAYSSRNRLSLVCELGYWRRLGWLAGVTVYPLYPNAYTAIGYRLPWTKVNNLSVYGGIDTDLKPVFGIFWRFGNS